MIYTLKPKQIRAFQWKPEETPPLWFNLLVEKGRAMIVINHKEKYIKIGNKRGEYKGLPHDWVCVDEYGHMFIWSRKTFKDRVE